MRLSVYDIAGHLVSRPVDRFERAGRHEARFGTTARRSQLYLYRLEWNGRVVVGKLTLMR